MGSFSTYRFPGADYSLARVNANWTPRGVVNNGTRVSGTTEAPIGAYVCKSGSTSGWTCGRIQAKKDWSESIRSGGFRDHRFLEQHLVQRPRQPMARLAPQSATISANSNIVSSI